MADSVKFIFKTLIKTPVIICIVYAIFNVFAFSYSYFRLLGVSYVAMQTVVENNYLPTQEETTLTDYLNGMNTEMLTGVSVIVNTDGPDPDAHDITVHNIRKQYGTPITVRVQGTYHFVFPLYHEENSTGGGMDGSSAQGFMEYEDVSGDATSASGPKTTIKITYRVPGLKYYADLD